MEEFEEAADEFVFKEFEDVKEWDDVALCHMVAFVSVILRWYKNKNCNTTLLSKDRYTKICIFC